MPKRTTASHDLPETGDEPQGWDELTSQARVEHLEKRFTVAVAAIEMGEFRTEHVFEAQAALASMRAELYGTPWGRAQHRNYETRLDRALGEQHQEDQGALR